MFFIYVFILFPIQMSIYLSVLHLAAIVSQQLRYEGHVSAVLKENVKLYRDI